MPQLRIGDDYASAVGSRQPCVQGKTEELVEQDGPGGHRQPGVGRLIELARGGADAAPARSPGAKPDKQWRTHSGFDSTTLRRGSVTLFLEKTARKGREGSKVRQEEFFLRSLPPW